MSVTDADMFKLNILDFNAEWQLNCDVVSATGLFFCTGTAISAAFQPTLRFALLESDARVSVLRFHNIN